MDEIQIPRGLRPRASLLGPAALALVLCGAAFFWLLWGRTPAPLIAPPATAASEASASPASVLVHVAGAVRHPGLYRLGASARVADAVEAAGGPTERADLDLLNLAEVLIDGVRIEVPRRGATVVGSVSSTTGEMVVSINSADQTQLETVPGIGPVKAAAIIAHRDEIGGFTSLDQLLEVDGIGPVTFETIQPYVAL